MATTKLLRLALGLVIPVASLGVLAAFNRATTAQVSEDLERFAIEQIKIGKGEEPDKTNR